MEPRVDGLDPVGLDAPAVVGRRCTLGKRRITGYASTTLAFGVKDVRKAKKPLGR